jgi:CRISPR/Cas system-associated exonuclease Cas4 (RecB family)
VLDYKTGHWSPNHARQVGLYALGVKHALGITPERVVLAYLQPEVIRPLRDEIVTQGMLDEAERLVATVGEGIRNGQFPPAAGAHCAKCPFVSACPAGTDETLTQSVTL